MSLARSGHTSPISEKKVRIQPAQGRIDLDQDRHIYLNPSGYVSVRSDPTQIRSNLPLFRTCLVKVRKDLVRPTRE